MRTAQLLLVCVSLGCAADRWDTQYFHDVKDEELRFNSIAFCSAERGVATGVLVKNRDPKAVALVTSNGGRTWTQMPLDEPGYGIYFFDETSGWMLTPSGIWFSDECGRNWRRVHKQRDLAQIRFLDRQTGWAVGARKTMLQTSDGGKTWSKVQAAEDLDANPDRTVFQVIHPQPPRGALIVGRSNPRTTWRPPVWLDPKPERRRELPALTITMGTADAGATWKADRASLFGRISGIAASKTGLALLLVQFDEIFEFPSELYTMSANLAQSTRSLRRKDLAITDIAASDAASQPVFYAAGFEPVGAVVRAPVPGKVRIIRSTDLKQWTDFPVDYRAVATNVMLSEKQGRVWAATDTGMILNLVRD